jgi:hypothetical protein
MIGAAVESSVVMKSWIILPYDDSPAAQARLRHAAQQATDVSGVSRYHGVVVATTGVDPDVLDRLLCELHAIAGPNVALDLRLLHAGDPIGDFRRLAAAFPDAVLTAPIGAAGWAPWFTEVCRFADLDHTLMLFFIRPAELRPSTHLLRNRHEPRNLGAVVQGWARTSAGLGRSLARGWHRHPAGTNGDEPAMQPEPATETVASARGDPNSTTEAESQRGSTSNNWQASS